MKELRPHQVVAIDQLRDCARRGLKRILLQLATGAGKTVVAAALFRLAQQKNPHVRVLFIVDAISLIDQTVRAFYAEGLHSIGVIQASHVMTDWSKPIQVASVQTLSKRGMPEADLVIVDECHRQHTWLQEIMASEKWANVPFIGLSATPWTKGLGNVFQELLIPVTMSDLIDQGYLSPYKVYAAAHPDLTGVKMVGSDYHKHELSEVMSGGQLVADIVDTWKRLGEGRPTLVFCVDRAHAKKVQLRFEQAGIACGYIDKDTEPHEREEQLAKLERGELSAITNIGTLTTGVDAPFVSCVVLARPTKSESLFVQIVGRGLRAVYADGMPLDTDEQRKAAIAAGPAPECLVLDHADNTLRLGFVTDIHQAELCTAKRGERSKHERHVALPKECPKCTFLRAAKVHECPACGFKPERQSKIEEEAGELIQVSRAKNAAPSRAEKQRFYSELYAFAFERGFKNPRGWTANSYRKRFGVWPQGLIQAPARSISPETRSFAKHCLIAFVKSRQAA